MKSLNINLKLILIVSTRTFTACMAIGALGATIVCTPFLSLAFDLFYKFTSLLIIGGLMLYLFLFFRKEWHIYYFRRFWFAIIICIVVMFFILCAAAHWEYRQQCMHPFMVLPNWLGGASIMIPSEYQLPSFCKVILVEASGRRLWAESIFSLPSVFLFSSMVIPTVLRRKKDLMKHSIQSSCVYDSGKGTGDTGSGPGPGNHPEDINNC